jgi:hypothetical protein
MYKAQSPHVLYIPARLAAARSSSAPQACRISNTPALMSSSSNKRATYSLIDLATSCIRELPRSMMTTGIGMLGVLSGCGQRNRHRTPLDCEPHTSKEPSASAIVRGCSPRVQ